MSRRIQAVPPSERDPATRHAYRGLLLPSLLMLAALALAAASSRGGEVLKFRLSPEREMDTLYMAGRFYPVALPGQVLEAADTVGWLLSPEERESLDYFRNGAKADPGDRAKHYDRIAQSMPEMGRLIQGKKTRGNASAHAVRRLQERVAMQDREAQRLRSAYLQSTDPLEQERIRQELQMTESALSRARRDLDMRVRNLESEAPPESLSLSPEVLRRIDSLLSRSLILAPASLDFEGSEQEEEGFRLIFSRAIPNDLIVIPCPPEGLPASLSGQELRHAGGSFFTHVLKVDAATCRIGTTEPMPASLYGEMFEVNREGRGSLIQELLGWRVEKVN